MGPLNVCSYIKTHCHVILQGTKHALHGFFDSIRHELVMNKVSVV